MHFAKELAFQKDVWVWRLWSFAQLVQQQQQQQQQRLKELSFAAFFDSGVFFSSDSEVTLGSFAVHFGRRFGTKLGGVLLFQKSCVSGSSRWRLWFS